MRYSDRRSGLSLDVIWTLNMMVGGEVLKNYDLEGKNIFSSYFKSMKIKIYNQIINPFIRIIWLYFQSFKDEILEGTALYISQLQRQLAAKLRTHGSGVGTGGSRHQSPHLATNINTNTASVDEIIKSISLTIATKGLNIKKKWYFLVVIKFLAAILYPKVINE